MLPELQVIFGRDMDFSGEGDGTDLAERVSASTFVEVFAFRAHVTCKPGTQEYDGRAGLSSQSVPRAGGESSDEFDWSLANMFLALLG